MPKPSKNLKMRVSVEFKCDDCGKEWKNIKVARQSAFQHSIKTGHITQGKMISTYLYNFGRKLYWDKQINRLH
jgi:hypothetical protein